MIGDKEMEKIYISWKEYDKMITALSNQILKSSIKYDLIITIPRGGLPIATSLAHKLNIKNVVTVEEYLTHEYKAGKFLLVDDISDKGDTLETELKNLKYKTTNKNAIFDIACLCYKPQTKVKPKYFSKVYLNDEWAIFPWENKDEKMVKDNE